MKRSAIKRDPEATRDWQQRSRRRLPAQSAKRAAAGPERAVVREEAFARDGWTCQMPRFASDAGPCFGPLTYHHLMKASAGGAYTLANGVSLCQGHNGMIEDRPEWARAHGLVIR